MSTLTAELRKKLERTVIQAREVAETAARAALQALAVPKHEPFGHMDSEQRRLRRRLRAHARQLGDRVDARSGEHGIAHLLQECAYQHWHGMLFARFLAENHLLIEPEAGIAITLDECEELAKEEGIDRWALAARFAQGMLPQVFRPDNPVFGVQFAREHRSRLEKLVEGLPVVVFTAADALGWVYQFWQTQKKNEVNRSEVKIGADELPAVTQLFTEPYMVQFMLHNSLGAWWAAQRLSADDLKMASSEQELRRKAALPGVALDYLRFVRNEDGVWSPAVGAFVVWPERLGKLRIIDPCCGSGHFLVAALLMLAPMRMALEELSATEAVDAVLRDNLHGLELDQRCVAIAAFALALEAWRYPDAGGFRTLPKLNLACCGQPVGGKREQWLALAGGDQRLEASMAALHDSFRDAPILGSLIDPARALPDDLHVANFAEARHLLEQALREHTGEEEWEETVIAAQGVTEAARLLNKSYHLVITNVPYLGREKHTAHLRAFCDRYYPLSKQDIATVFIERLLQLCAQTGKVLLVLPQYWLFLSRYKALRRSLLEKWSWLLLATLGPGAFDSISGEVVNTCLVAIGRLPKPPDDSAFWWIDVSNPETKVTKASLLQEAKAVRLLQTGQLRNPDSVVGYVSNEPHALLENRAYCYQGLATSDNAQFIFKFWEIPRIEKEWDLFQFAPDSTAPVSGCSHILLWEEGQGKYASHAIALKKEGRLGGWKSGHGAWGKRGIAINRMGGLPVSLYFGTKFDCNVAVLIPNDKKDIPAIWAYSSSPDYGANVRKLNSKLSVTNATLAKVPYDSAKWEKTIENKGLTDLYRISTLDPTQWTFNGYPRQSTESLQVAVARLLGYHWPAENNIEVDLAEDALAWVENAKSLYPLEDADGVVCIPSVRSERPAHERLLEVLQKAWGDEWSNDVLAKLLASVGCVSLDDWLRSQFFVKHCKLFQHRPFIWHIWDGRERDGFHALVNYHKLAEGDGKGRRLLESLAYSYLGDWISRHLDGAKRSESGAEGRLAAALRLQKRLIAILEGEPPFDLFIRWKSIESQPIGWEPDLKDGLRLNIRPFMFEDIPGGKKGAGILRAKPNIHWKKDRGREPVRNQERFPWFWRNGKFTGERVNDVHYDNEERRRGDGK